MAHKLEKLYEELTGTDPNLLEPKPPAQVLARKIQAIRRGGGNEPLSTAAILYELIETDREMPVDSCPSRPFSVIRRTLPDGRVEHAFVWNVSLSPEEVPTLGAALGKSDWFELNENCKL